MKCLFCQKGPVEGVSVYRVNAKGQAGVWACARHVSQTDAAVDEYVRAVTEALTAQRAKEAGRGG